MKIKKEIEFEILHSNKHRIYLLCGIVCVVVLMVTLIITTSKAKYRTTQSLPLINGTINYELSDLNLIGAYIQEGEEYNQTNDIPSNGYEFNSEKSYCTVNGENINATINFDIETQTLSVVPLTKKGTKCYLYFDEKASGSEYILASPNAPTGTTTDWTGQTTYYYTGKPNNWVQFGTNSSGQPLYWRIIRINGDGSIRMIYQGTGFNTTGTRTQIGTSAFNSLSNNNMYVGYMYTSGQRQGHDDPSTIKGILDTWYQNNLADEADYIDGNAGFCGDRRVSSGTGTGTSRTYYQPYTRMSNSSPSLSCETPDIYTTSGSSTGNGALTYPIGLISADEAMYAGIPWGVSNTNNYLYTGQYYWTMSPYYFYGSSTNVFVVYDDSSLYYGFVGWTDYGVRPVINLRSDVPIAGSGTTSDPFKVVGAS